MTANNIRFDLVPIYIDMLQHHHSLLAAEDDPAHAPPTIPFQEMKELNKGNTGR